MLQNHGLYIEKISEHVLNATFESFDQATLQNAKNRILDLLGCSLSGARGPGNAALVDLVKAWGGNEESTIFVYGGKAPAHNVAMVNSILARSFDFEAIGAFVEGVDLPSHISITTVPTALALGEAREVTGKDLLTALLVGDDLASRILAASGFGFTLGWDGNGTVNAFGATAIAGRLLGLTQKQMQDAFGIVLNQLGGTFQNVWDGSLCFKLPCALSARNGIFSAELAKAGWDGPDDALFSRFGYFSLFTEGCADEEILTKNIGQKFYTEATFKPYPCCRANHAAIDCALNIVHEHEVDINHVEDIILKVPPRVRDMFVGQPFALRRNPQVDAAFSLQFCVANVLLRKGITIEHFKDEYIREPEILNLAGKVKVEGFGPQEQGKRAALLKVKMKDGSEYVSEVQHVKGGPVENTLSQEEIKDKFRENVTISKTIPEENGEKIISIIDNLEEVDDISELTKLLVEPDFQSS